jgi:Leucine-rich repeat (LRR) protein/PKD repeat protein
LFPLLITAQIVNIPDANFKAALVGNGEINTNGDDEIQVSEAEAYSGSLDVSDLGIADMTGLEAFIGLTALYCDNNDLEELDVASNELLEQLNCAGNQLSRLVTRSNSLLKNLNCQSNALELLDLRENVALVELSCQSNQLNSLDIRNGANTSITHFDATENAPLTCITVDNAAYSAANWDGIDPGAIFSENGCNVYIPDANFKAALVANTEVNTNNDGEIQVSEAEAFTGSLYLYNLGIADMTGLEAFTALIGLYCGNNDLEELDVSANTALQWFYCSYNKLTELEVNANTALQQLSCSSNPLTTLDVSANTALQSLSCGNNQLADLDVNANTALQSLYCSSNQLTTLDVSANTALQQLSCYSNQLTTLDVSANTALQSLSCSSNPLTTLDVSANTALQSLYCDSNQLTNLDVSANTALQSLSCDSNQLTTLGVSANTALQSLSCYSNQLTSLDLGTNTTLEYLSCSSNPLTTLDVSANTALQSLYCSSNQLTTLDVSANTALQSLNCYSNQLTTLDVSANTVLRELFCYNNQLRSLNIRNENNTLITRFDATGNPLLSCVTVSDETYANDNWSGGVDQGVVFSELGCNVYIPDANFKAALVENTEINTNGDQEIQFGEAEAYTGSIDVANLSISDITGLEAFKFVTALNCSGNNLSQLLIGLNAALEQLDCSDNQLSHLDVSALTALESLYCANNQISMLDVQSNANLSQLQSQSNLLEILDLSQNSNLTELQCQSNQLRSIDVKNGNNETITLFDARNNPMLTCIAVDDAAYSAANWTNVDAEGLFNEQGCAVVHIPDPAFKTALVANTSINTNGDPEIQYSEAAAFTGSIDVHALGISDMTGLEAFTGLSGLDCSSNSLSQLDVASNELLEQLNCADNQLSRLVTRSNGLLETLNCQSNALELLDLRENVALVELHCQSNQLNSLDIRNGANTSITHFDATDNAPLTCITVDDAAYSAANWSGIDAGAIFSENGCNVYIPDANFKAALVANSSINTNGDYEIQVSEAEAFSGSLQLYNLGIADMTGLEAFNALIGLYCESNQLSNLDVSMNSVLQYLYCSGNNLKTLDVSANTALQHLNCYSNQLTTLDVSANTALQSLSCGNNQLADLDVSANTALQWFSCSSNQLTTLDVSANTALQWFSCSSNQLTTLDVSANTALENLSCDYNQLTSLNVSANTALRYLYCYENQLKSLNIRNGNNAALTSFYATGNPSLSCITVSDETYANDNWSGGVDQGVVFSELGCNVYIPDANFKAALVENTEINTNGDTEIQFGEAEAYTGSIDAANLSISDMTGLEAFKSVTALNCSGNNLSQLLVRANSALESVDCSSNQLTSIDFSNNPLLENINCSVNQLTGLDVVMNAALGHLECDDNRLISLNVRNGSNNLITVFDATNNPYLSCISVDDEAYSQAHWTNIDVHTSFNNDCSFAAAFEADVMSGPLPLTVQFTDRSTSNADAWLWNFGNGNTSTDQSPMHTYAATGSYTVSLTISDGLNNDVESKSDFVEVLKGSQTITFGQLEAKAFGDADFELSATSSSGLAVSYASSDQTVATIEGSTVRIVGVGATTITASQAGDDNYHAATDVLQSLTVDKANQTITFASLDSKTYGDADFELSATSSSGLVVSYASSDETVAAVEGSTVRIVGAGATTITAAQAGDDNYQAATDVLQTLTVDKANQTITFASLDSKTYGDADFELLATSSSGLAVSYASSDQTVATIEGSTVRIVGVGATTVTAAQAGDDNYQAATDVLQTLTVDKANQTITFASLDSKTYGDADFELLATSSSGLAVSYASSDETVATVEGSTVRIVGVGATTITAAQAGDDNYQAATDVLQTLTVDKADQTITFASLDSKTYGDADFELSATSSSGLAVTYVSSNTTVATIDGSTVSIHSGGATSITASQAGDDNYQAAADVTQDLTVNRTTQTITFDAIPDQLLDDGVLVLSATASSGLDVSYTISEGPATVNGSTVTFTGVGTVTVLASQEGDANYHPANPVTQSFDIFEITALDVDEDASLLLYPNPASNMIVVEFSADIHRVRMINLNGQIVYEKRGIDKLGKRLEIDTSLYPTGEYIIRLEGEDSVVSRKVILSR